MAPIKLPDAAVLRQILDYNPETGSLAWKPRPDDRRFTTRYGGKEAFTSVEPKSGYRRGRIDSVTYLAHRIIWKIVTGVEPETIDHIDGDRTNNKFANLRSVPFGVNSLNRCRRKDCPHEKPGVRTVAGKKKPWGARIGFGGKNYHLGTFATREEAVAAREAAERRIGFIDRS